MSYFKGPQSLLADIYQPGNQFPHLVVLYIPYGFRNMKNIPEKLIVISIKFNFSRFPSLGCCLSQERCPMCSFVVLYKKHFLGICLILPDTEEAWELISFTGLKLKTLNKILH